jgi:hypothetical protein
MAIRRRPSIARSTIHRGSSSMRSLGSLSPFGAGQRLGGRSRCASRSRWRLPSPWRSLRVGSSRRDTTLAPTTPGHVRDCAPTATRQRSSSYRKRASYLRVVRGQDLNLRPLGDEHPIPPSHPCHSVASFRASHRAVSTCNSSVAILFATSRHVLVTGPVTVGVWLQRATTAPEGS